jgi:hypothetical protein
MNLTKLKKAVHGMATDWGRIVLARRQRVSSPATNLCGRSCRIYAIEVYTTLA